MTTSPLWLARLVQIPSVTPPQAGPRAGAPGEGRLAAAVAGWFADLGAEVVIDEVAPGRPNVYGIWRGRGERWLGLDVHLDTVGVEQMRGDPFGGELRDGRVYGRGAVDTKASLAVALALVEQARAAGQDLGGNLLLAATVDEEETATGAPALADWLRRSGITLDELIVAEPTGCAPVYGHKGVARAELTIRGVAAHSSRPHQGRNAISAAAAVIMALDAEHERLQGSSATHGPRPLSSSPAAQEREDAPQRGATNGHSLDVESHPLLLAQPTGEGAGGEGRRPPEARDTSLGPPTLSVTLIGGGRGVNVVPDECRITFDRRVVAGESAAEVGGRIVELARAASPLPVEARTILALDAFWQDPDHPWVRQLAAWAGAAPEPAAYGTNAFAYPAVARACVVLGPGSIAQAHGDEEWVAVAELERLEAIYRKWWGL